ncbi:MAG: Beta-galactosidase C-terminal domain, partial [Carnobacterium inhibens]
NSLINEPKFEVSVQTRINEGVSYYFLMNFSTDTQEVVLNKTVVDIESSETIEGKILLNPYEVRVLKE